MKFISTRGRAPQTSFSDVLLAGLAPDGGLYLPEGWPQLTGDEIAAFKGARYQDVAFAVLSRFTAGSFGDGELREAIEAAYSDFDAPDIAPLVEYFLKKYGRRYRNGIAELPPEVLHAFLEYEWPGNVRELENMVRRLVVLNDPGLVLDELRTGSRVPNSAPSLPTACAGDPAGMGGPPRLPARVSERSGERGAERMLERVPERVADPTPWTAPAVGAAGAWSPEAGNVVVGASGVMPVGAVPTGAGPAVGGVDGNVVAGSQRYLNPFAVPQPPPPPPEKPESEMSLKDIGRRAAMLAEREAILAMLQRTAWNKRKAASKLKISYKALLYKIKECGIVDPRSNAEF